jgi:threonylcarbamoyladenosine tRNA methylthiotransferase MtaB
MTTDDNMRPTFVVTTLGCKVNQCESDALARHLEQQGVERIQGGGDDDTGVETSGAAGVDLCIINTCTVTHKAAMQSRQAIRQAVRRHPAAQIIVTGCYAQIEPDVLAGIEGVDAVVGHGHKFELSQLIRSRKTEFRSAPDRLWSPVREEKVFAHLPVQAFGARTRPFLRIQDGCDAFCTYCIVPHARGPSRSMPPHQVVLQLAALGTEGFREVVLTGIHLGAYGQDLSPATSFAELLNDISAAGAVAQLRLSSIEPAELTTEIIATVAESQGLKRGRICPHFHIPLQSGDDEILARMHRPNKGTLFDDRVLAIHRSLPQAAIGVDTLIGFPGESERAFENTYRRIEALPVTYLHVFPFSPRAGTPAFHFKDKVPQAVIKERCRRMRALGERKKRTFYQSLVGQCVRVLVEGRTGRGERIKGTTPNYVPVTMDFRGSAPDTNTFVDVIIREVTDDLGVIGNLKR